MSWKVPPRKKTRPIISKDQANHYFLGGGIGSGGRNNNRIDETKE